MTKHKTASAVKPEALPPAYTTAMNGRITTEAARRLVERDPPSEDGNQDDGYLLAYRSISIESATAFAATKSRATIEAIRALGTVTGGILQDVAVYLDLSAASIGEGTQAVMGHLTKDWADACDRVDLPIEEAVRVFVEAAASAKPSGAVAKMFREARRVDTQPKSALATTAARRARRHPRRRTYPSCWRVGV
jgi:hypothetical protein